MLHLPASPGAPPASPAGSALAGLDDLRPTLDALSLPGGGATLGRWQTLADVARRDLSVARLAEGHADARAILCELGRDDLLADAGRLGVWAAEPARLRARSTPEGWRLDGEKGWCSGSTGLDHALVTAVADDGPRLFLVAPGDPAVAVEPGSWTPTGMVATCSVTLRFRGLVVDAGAAVGAPAAYVERPGFGHGGAGVAACWWGGAAGLVDDLRRAGPGPDDVAAALGESAAEVEGAWACLGAAAQEIDAHPLDRDVAERVAARTRLVVTGVARRVLHRSVEALGASGLCHDPVHAGRAADLQVYLAQLRRRPAAVAYGRGPGPAC